MNEETGYPDSARGRCGTARGPEQRRYDRPIKKSAWLFAPAAARLIDCHESPLPEIINENRYYLHLHLSVKPDGPE